MSSSWIQQIGNRENVGGEREQSNASIEKYREELTERQVEILQLSAEGKSTKIVASELFLAYETIKWQRKEIIRKMGASNFLHAVVMAMREGKIQ